MRLSSLINYKFRLNYFCFVFFFFHKRSFNSTVKLSKSHIILHVKLTGKLPFQLCANFTVKLAEFYLILHVKRNKSKFSSTKGQITRKKC
jgi:hypothetical protein